MLLAAYCDHIAKVPFTNVTAHKLLTTVFSRLMWFKMPSPQVISLSSLQGINIMQK